MGQEWSRLCVGPQHKELFVCGPSTSRKFQNIARQLQPGTVVRLAETHFTRAVLKLLIAHEFTSIVFFMIA